MWEFRDEVIVNSVLCRPQDDHWPRIVNCKQEPQAEAPPVLQAADPSATFGIDLPSPCWQWVLLLTQTPKVPPPCEFISSWSRLTCPSRLTQATCVAPWKVLQLSRAVDQQSCCLAWGRSQATRTAG